MGSRARTLVGLLLIFLTGCGDGTPPPPVQNVGQQIQQTEPDLKGQRFSSLLDFETSSDEVFVSTSGLSHSIDNSRGHTGRASLRLQGASGKLTIKLASLLSNRPFPADWTLLGAYFYTDRPAQITASCASVQTRVFLNPGQWTPVFLDLTDLPPTASPTLSFNIVGGPIFWCDDVLLINNTQWIIGSEEIHKGGGWTIRRSGPNFVCEVPWKFSIRLATQQANSDGWQVEESNAIRARFSSTGKDKSLTIYADGRSYWDGKFRALASDLQTEPLWQEQQASPAEIEIPEAMGRLDRRSPGDANNDGYNEARASYSIIATGSRLEVKITPRSVSMLRPMLQITGLPPGKVIATVEGRLIDQTIRLEDGSVLVEVPGRINVPTFVDLHVE